MVYFAKWKIVLVLLVCALGAIYAAPNLLGRPEATVAARTDVSGAFGSFSIQANGRWTYVLDTGSAQFQALPGGDSRTDSFTVAVTDGSGSQSTRDVTVTVRGGEEEPQKTGVLDLSTAHWTDDLPAWLPINKVNLGLDLQGGTHLLARVEYQQIIDRQLLALEENIRRPLREADIGRQGGIEIRGDAVVLTLRNQADIGQLRDVVAELDARFQVEMDPATGVSRISFSEDAVAEVRNNALAQSIEIIRGRIDQLGTTEPNIQRQGEDRVLVQVPGEGDSQRVKDLLRQTARMSFHLLHDNWLPGQALPTTPPRRAFIADSYETIPGTDDQPVQRYLVSRTENVSGESLVDAQPTLHENRPVVSFRFDAGGARDFADTTRANTGRFLAILLDNKVISAPRINEPILAGAGIIEGQFGFQEASDLALLLRAGALPADLTFLEERTVGPSLGADSIAAGKAAAVIGMALVVVFMVATYGMFGAMAVVALLFNLALILAALSGIQATLTLPGIAGIVLTVGMAVDANVLIFERIREEIANKRSPISAIDAGYSRAMTTIIDSNLTTGIAALLLFALGSGPIKGFAITLGFGILASMFTAIMVTRLMVVTWLRRTRPKSIPI